MSELTGEMMQDPRAELDQLAEATIAALRAPSILNTQPWRWRLVGNTAELWVDRARQLPNVDPDGRLLMLSCGIALDYALTALRAAGYRGEAHRLDNEHHPIGSPGCAAAPGRRPTR